MARHSMEFRHLPGSNLQTCRPGSSLISLVGPNPDAPERHRMTKESNMHSSEKIEKRFKMPPKQDSRLNKRHDVEMINTYRF